MEAQLSACNSVMLLLCVLEVWVMLYMFLQRVPYTMIDSEYRDRLELRLANDRTLGVGVNLTTNFLLILTATTMMKVSLDLEKIQAFKPE